MQEGACGCSGVLPTAPLMPCPLHLSSREKTSCTASRWHPRSRRSPRVSRMCPTPGSRQPQGPRPCLRCLRCLPHGRPAHPPVTQCRTEGSTRGLAAVPRLALDVMACEVLRVLQLTDTALVPVSYLVPGKVRGGCGWHCVMGTCAISWVTPRQHWVTKGTQVSGGDPSSQPGESRRGCKIWVLMVGSGSWRVGAGG